MKYRQLGDFHEYYSGARVAPYLTIFCGGNHEASNYLFELHYGGWVAPNVFFMGAANVLRLGPLRIAGMSGIWKGYDYRKSHGERLPYSQDEISSIYHIREIDVRKLLHLRTQIDVGLSHDWPRGIEGFGNTDDLFRKKGHLREDSAHGSLGSPAAREVLDCLRPGYWFSAHLHVKFLAAMPHDATLRAVTPGENEPVAWAFDADAKAPIQATSESSMGQQTTKPEHNLANRIGLAAGNEDARIQAWNSVGSTIRENEIAAARKFRADWEAGKRPTAAPSVHRVTWKKPGGAVQDVSEYVGGVRTSVIDNNSTQDGGEIKLASGNDNPTQNDDEIELASSNGSSRGSPSSTTSDEKRRKISPMSGDGAAESVISQPLVDRAVAQAHALRTKLPGSFAPPPASPTVRKRASPEGVTNHLTKFMALDKPRNYDPYVELVEVKPISEPTSKPTDPSANTSGPLRLQYDKEWLAITRVFADDLELGTLGARVPPRPDEATALAAILDAENWIDQNVVQKGLMDVPLNFCAIAPVHDPASSVMNPNMPMEYPNNQTEDFCNLIGIKNKFALTEEERAARMAAGPQMAARNTHGASSDGRSHRGKRGGRGRGGRGPGKKPRTDHPGRMNRS